MNLSTNAATNQPEKEHGRSGSHADVPRHYHTSAVSWSAILAGAAAAAALSLILVILGAGLGFSSVSPWARQGVNATTLGVSAILWLTVTQIIVSGMGGYLAGRLRTKWSEVHRDEVYFRDTAHGFLAWAIASLATAAFLTSAIGSAMSGGIGSTMSSGMNVGASLVDDAPNPVKAGVTGAVASAGVNMAKSGSSESMNYFLDSLFRKDIATPSESSFNASSIATRNAVQHTASKPEAGRIFMNTLSRGTLLPNDIRYVGQLVSQRTGLAPQDAEKRVAYIYTQLQERVRDTELATQYATDKARNAAAYTSIWLFISLLIGAFVASLMATYGGKRRDAC